MLYIPYVIINILFDGLCIIANPFLPFFADEKGYLPNWLRWFGTFGADASLDQPPEWIALHWAHLVDRPDWPDWANRVLRYVRRVTWLYRNTGYGFAKEILGHEMTGIREDFITEGDQYVTDVGKGKSGYMFIHDRRVSPWLKGWCYYRVYQYPGTKHCLRLLLGWKLMALGVHGPEKAMLAMHFNPWMRFGTSSTD